MKIVIVEDELDILRGMTEALEKIQTVHAFERIYAFDNAEQALELINEQLPEIVITDIVLPQTNLFSNRIGSRRGSSACGSRRSLRSRSQHPTTKSVVNEEWCNRSAMMKWVY